MIDRKQALWGINDDEDKLFLSRMCDLAQKSENTYSIMYSKFLNPKQQMLVTERISPYTNVVFWGGFEGADRVMAAFVPTEWDEPDYPITGIKAIPTNKRTYSHRDYLGSVLALGITRELMGDIIITDDGAVFVVMRDIADFIMMNLTRVATATVKLSAIGDLSEFSKQTRFKESSVTVSSLRFDCVLSAAANKSRADSASFIEMGLASINYEVVKNTSRQIKSGDVISLKGFGKVIVETDGTLTKKGRIHINIKKYV